MNSAADSKTLVTFWGTRGSISTPGRITEKYGGNTPCITISHQSTLIIVDAGTGIRNLGFEILRSRNGKDAPLNLHLFLSHTHWDHIQGLPFFQPAYRENTRLTIYGSSKKEKFLASALKGQMDYEYFPVPMSALTADIHIREMDTERIRLGSIEIDLEEQVHHPAGSVRYGFNIHGKRIVFATDVELDLIFGREKKSREEKKHAEQYLRFVHGADLLIADGQFTEEEYAARRGWGHSSIPVVLEAASRGKVKQLAIFHHDPQHSDKVLDEIWMKYRTRYHAGDHGMDLFWAREGLTVAV
ncbi:MAG: MBL fold metallo-hydrolase [Deltaproteobacteria bacterium]|nr:MBL fold metallo-hydrolase [Deltaproteobacteria bacterium]